MLPRYYMFVLLVVMAMCTVTGSYAQSQHTFSLAPNAFLLDGKPMQIISGEMHPARIPREYWQHRIQMAKAMGCNTIALYVFWNYHESTPGVFDFSTGNRDVAAFIKLCQQEGMWVLLRPGPYVCGEWDFGGLPPYLLSNPRIRIRTSDTAYMHAVGRYIKRLSKEIQPLLCTNGGPILMLQVENEYGSYGNDKNYMLQLKQLWEHNGINVPFYTSDGPDAALLEAGTVPGAAIGMDSGNSDADFELAHRIAPNMPSFSGETYPGWLTHWTEQWQHPGTDGIVKQVKYLMDHNRSFNLYVIHGGTNFGFTAGANAFNPTQFQPDVTSYDYDAPINEQGRPTEKYYALQMLIAGYAKDKLPDVPAPVKAMTIPAFELKPVTDIWNNLPVPQHRAEPEPMEYLGQYSGFILYRTKLVGHKSGELTITEPHDYALVLLNGKLIDTVYRDGGKWTVKLPATTEANPVLDILVENMGHINFAQYMKDRKGITNRVTLNGMTLMNWDIYNLPMADKWVTNATGKTSAAPHDGVFFNGSFTLADTADTYIDMSRFSKGVVWVNGHNLGRYWHVGPQQRLYCPAPWLRKGKNSITVFDLHLTTPATVCGYETLYGDK
jgi:beta-galactosidase